MHDLAAARVDEHALELEVEPQPQRPGELGARLAAHDELGLAERHGAARRARERPPLGLVGRDERARRRAPAPRRSPRRRSGCGRPRRPAGRAARRTRARRRRAGRGAGGGGRGSRGRPATRASVSAPLRTSASIRAPRAGCRPGRGRRAGPWPRAAAGHEDDGARAAAARDGACGATSPRRTIGGGRESGQASRGLAMRRPEERRHEASRALGRADGGDAPAGPRRLVRRLARPRTPGWSRGCSRTARSSRLHPQQAPGSYLHRSHPSDVARTEHLTFIASRDARGRRAHQQLDVARRRRASACARSSTAR